MVRLTAISILLVGLLIGCGSGQDNTTAGPAGHDVTAVPAAEQTTKPAEKREASGFLAYRLPTADTSLRERIAGAEVVTRVEYQSVRQVVEAIDALRRNNDNTVYVNALEYRFRVVEYLKGSGSTEIVGIAYDPEVEYATREEAEDSEEDFVSARDTRWDDLEAVVFLRTRHFHSTDSVKQSSDRYTLGILRFPYYLVDGYTISSGISKTWLPSASSTGGSEYLMDDPASAGPGGAPTITLSELKAEIAAVEAEVAAGDGTDAYRDCIYYKYSWESRDQTRYDALVAAGGDWTPDRHEVESGRAPSATFHDIYRTDGVRYWLEGEDADLFTIVALLGYGRIQATRPLPAGEYRYMYLDRPPEMDICDAFPEAAKKRLRHIMVATAPAGVLHESFFDPVTVGPAVLADGSNGVLEPASFTDANSVSATLESLSYEAPAGSGQTGTVKLKLDPHDGLTGHALDFIGLDGEVSLSLDVLDATVDSANKTLSWSVSTQPWEEGDQLMLRIREAPCSSSTVVADAGNEPGLVGDCEALLGLRDALAGTGTLNWGEDRAITSWDGVTVGGTPKRVTVLNLRNKGLTGVVPVGLGELTGLEELLLGNNQLTGEIPVELGDLVNLRKLQLRYNSLSGEIPAELGSLSALTVLWLHSNRLTGEIPVELGDLSDLEELWLNTNQLSGPVPWELGELSELTSLQLRGNSFAGCLRPSLRDIGDNDLSRLGLTYCTESGRVPAPGDLSVTLSEGTFTLTWNTVTCQGRSDVRPRGGAKVYQSVVTASLADTVPTAASTDASSDTMNVYEDGSNTGGRLHASVVTDSVADTTLQPDTYVVPSPYDLTLNSYVVLVTDTAVRPVQSSSEPLTRCWAS